MLNLNLASMPQGVSYEGTDAGSGAGGSGGGSQAGQQGGGQSSFSGQQSSSSQGGSAPVAYSDDMQITRDGKTMTMKEFISSQYVPKSDYDNVKQLTRQEIENNLRRLAQTLQQQKQQHGQPQQPQQRVDPLAGVRDVPILSGQQLAQALDGTLGPVAQAVANLQQQNQQLIGVVKKLQGGVGTLAKERSGQERQSRVSSAIAALGEGYDAKDPFLQDVAQDILDAWEFDKPEEFTQMLQSRVNAMKKFFTAQQQADLKRAKERRFVRPGGGASPSGNARYNPATSKTQIADMLFGPRNGASANT